jgi:hypothetical protein
VLLSEGLAERQDPSPRAKGACPKALIYEARVALSCFL